MKRYEGLFVLNVTAKEDGIKETIEKISAEITAAGGQIETVQKMDKRSFARIADKRHTGGYYVNVIFNAEPTVTAQLPARFALNEEIFRVLFTQAPPIPAVAAT